MEPTRAEVLGSEPTLGARDVREYGSGEGFVIKRNVVFIGLAFMIHFTAFLGTANLQSSVNPDAALGTTTLAVIYGSLILSNIFLPMTIIRWLGCKYTMALAFVTYMPFIAAQFHPSWGTLIPAGLAVGLGGGPLWCAKCTYLSIFAEAMTHVTGKEQSNKDANTMKFFGLFFIFFQMAQVWGNLISSFVLTFPIDAVDLDNMLNTTISTISQSVAVIESNTTNQVGQLCGANFCPGITAAVNPNLDPPEEFRIHILAGIFLACMVVAVLLIVFCVYPTTRYGVKRGEHGDVDMSGLQLLTATLQQLRSVRQILILPITMFIGMEEAFLAVDFTQSFVACGWGIGNIGYAMICFGVANAISAGVCGNLVAKIGRVKVAIGIAIINLTLFGYMFFYEAHQGDYMYYCAFAAIWGFCDGAWLVVVNAFYGILFPKNLIAAYSNFRLWESTGSVIGYILSSQLCTSTKMMLLMGILLVGLAGYLFIEYRYWTKLRDQQL